MKRPWDNRKKRGPGPAESRIVDSIDFMLQVGPDVDKLIAIVRDEKFTLSLKLQKEAALIYRGIHMKIRSLDACVEAKDHRDKNAFMEILDALRQEYSQIYNRIPIDVTSDGKGLTMVLAPASISKPKKSGVS